MGRPRPTSSSFLSASLKMAAAFDLFIGNNLAEPTFLSRSGSKRAQLQKITDLSEGVKRTESYIRTIIEKCK